MNQQPPPPPPQQSSAQPQPQQQPPPPPPPQQQHGHNALQQVIPGPGNGAPPAPKPVAAAPANSMQPPPPPSQMPSVPSALSTSGLVLSPNSPQQQQQRPIAPVTSATKIMPMKPPQTAIAQRPALDSQPPQTMAAMDDKKQQKRAANRRSAQLSRKRKKQFIEELKEENDELRRKEQILKSIPDLIVVFDSAGRLWFVSHSVSRFLDFTPVELEGSSFWDRLCDESVRLLKAAFMDALAARKSDMDTTPLGSGVWELRLVDKDGSHKVVTLNGVVHFSGDAPECVCSIRPRDEQSIPPSNNIAGNAIQQPVNGTTTGGLSPTGQPLIQPTIKPHQSVISNGTADDASVRLARGKAAVNLQQPQGATSNGRKAAQISDGDSGSVVSESGSDE